MRIIGGRAKGRRILIPKVSGIRPTSDMLKEALFNILPSMKGRIFLDLFAGSGGVGLEALSRGAAKVVFIEVDPRCIEIIKRNLGVCGFDDGYEVISAPVAKGVKLLSKRKEQFNIIFADPPYEKGMVKEIFHLRGICNLTSKDGIMVIQHSLREEPGLDIDNIILADQRKYGDTVISLVKLRY